MRRKGNSQKGAGGRRQGTGLASTHAITWMANGWMTCMFPAPARARPPGTSQLMLAVVSWTGRRTLLTISSKQTDKTRYGRPCQCGTARCQRVRQLWPTLAAQQPRILRFYSAAPRSARSFNVTRFFCPGQAIGLLVGIAGPDFHDEDGPGQEGQLTEDVILFDIAQPRGMCRSPIPSAASSCGR